MTDKISNRDGKSSLTDIVEDRSMRRVFFGLALLGATVLGTTACNEVPPINQVGVNVVQKSIFQGSWYMSRTVIDVDYEAAGIGTFPGDAASDFVGGGFTAMPRVRWVIDENFLYAYRDYELVAGLDGEPRAEGADLGQPVAAYKIESHFDIKRDYNTVTGEETNVVMENDSDRRWYERDFMRVDWSKNILPGYYGQTYQLYELLGLYTREPADLFVQSLSEFPDSWRPRFHYMPCNGSTDTSAACTDDARDWADDYAQGELYAMDFVNQDLMSPGLVPDPFTGAMVNWCASIYSDAPLCTAFAVYVRTSFLKVSDTRQYEAENWVDSRFDVAGYFRNEQPTYDRSTGITDPQYGSTDFLNYSVNRHNIWKSWHDDAGNSIPYADRDVRKIVWYTTPELPAHLVQPSFELVSEWNQILMRTVRNLRGEPEPNYPRVACQNTNPDNYCFCTLDPVTSETLLPDTDGDGIGDCAGRYDPLETPEQATARGVSAPFQCWVDVPAGAEPNMEDPAVGARLTDEDFYGWYGAKMEGDECINVLRINSCDRAAVAANGGTVNGLNCEERGDMRYKFLSYVDQPGTAFLGIATMRVDPVSGEIMTGDANIGGPALDSYLTFALQQYDILNGDISEQELLIGEDVRGYLESLNNVNLPAPPRTDFSVAALAGRASPAEREGIDRRWDSIMERANQLRGPDGRSNVYSDRMRSLAGTDLERRLLDNPETYVMAGLNKVPQGAGVTEHMLDSVSPFRGHGAPEQLAQVAAVERKLSGLNIHLPNEYIDDSVLSYVQQHRGWPRARLEFELNRLLFYETELHEMGHCMGLRHSFAASADYHNYQDDYYYINEAFPLPEPDAFDTDPGVAGLSSEDQIRFQAAYDEARSVRDLAGIDRWMNASTMEYTANWYERVVTAPGRYDFHALAYAYGDLIEVNDNAAGLPVDEINPTNTARPVVHFYNGGESCTVDSDCPSSATGSRAANLLPLNMEAGLTQRCLTNPREPTLGGVCSSTYQDLAEASASSDRYTAVPYMYCTDERAAGLSTALGTIGLCNRFDEGASYREIVQNVQDSYERMYLWTNFRRYRSGFDFGNYIFNQLIGRRLVILQNVYQNLMFNYSSDPDFRTVNRDKPFGFYDQFLATADIMNFYGRIMASPDVGAYRYDNGWKRYRRTSVDPDLPGAQLSIPIGLGRYFGSVYQAGLSGINRIERIGTFYDKLFVMQLMTQRGAQAGYTPDLPFFTNFYDLFPLEMNQIFSGFIRDDPTSYAPRLVCEGTFPNCDNAQVVYMNYYRGDCAPDSTASDCRPDPIDVTYRDMPVLDGGGSIVLQIYAAIYGLSEFPVFFDTTFQNQLFVCIEGNGACYVPSDTAVEGTDYARYVSRRYGKSFLAYQVEPTATISSQESIGFQMVKEASNTDFIVFALQSYRGDFCDLSGDPLCAPNRLANLSAADRARLTALAYTIPTDTLTLDREVDRLYGRLRDLESFFNQLIQLENEIGITGYLGF